MNKVGIPHQASTALLVIDVQEKLMPVIDGASFIFENVNKLIKGAEILSLKTIVTEQYPKGLGKTCNEIILPQHLKPIEKITFSCLQSSEVVNQLIKSNITDIIICGVEAHICVLKTALEALQNNFRIHIVADAVSSRTPENKQLSIKRLEQSGAYIVSTEMILFMLMNQAGTEEFKAISRLIK